MNEHPAAMNATIRTCGGSRFWVAALVIFHLALTLATAVLGSLIHSHHHVRDFLDSVFPSIFAGSVFSILANGLFGIQVGQFVLITCWGAFANQPVPLRIPRFLTLFAWVSLSWFLGEFLIEGVIAKLLVEEELAGTLILMTIPVVVLFIYNAILDRKFLFHNSQPGKSVWQFSIRRALLITAELSALFALARVVLPRNFQFGEVWPGITQIQTIELIPVALSTTILPVVFFGFARQRTWRAYLLLGLYLWIPASVLTALHMACVLRSVASPADYYWLPETLVSLSGFLAMHFSAAATILVTFWALRRIGYDFRRRDELPRAGSASNANSSAASAAA